MTNFKTKLATGLVTATILAGTAAPAFAATNVVVAGNGAFSTNKVGVFKLTLNTKTQNNTSVVSTKVTTLQNTGGNSSSFNTGGANTITTGPATSTVTTTVTGGTNNMGAGCGCPTGDTNVGVVGNGAFSHNGVGVVDVSVNHASQTNTQVVSTNVGTGQNTGFNSAWFNTGGTNGITTGGASSTVTTTVGGNTNTAL